jgi:hypothetical protein
MMIELIIKEMIAKALEERHSLGVTSAVEEVIENNYDFADKSDVGSIVEDAISEFELVTKDDMQEFVKAEIRKQVRAAIRTININVELGDN